MPVPVFGASEAGSEVEVDAFDIKPSAPEIEPERRGNSELLLDKQSPQPRRPAPARRIILSRPLRYYLLSLFEQSRYAEAIATFSSLLNQGYTMDNLTWNSFIQSLSSTSPPLALLAFVLTERFLIPQFPGWSKSTTWPLKPQARAEGLQHMRARYLAPSQLLPTYKTIVKLGAALLQTRRTIALGRKGLSNMPPELVGYVGALRDIRKRAPKTLFAVQSMPAVSDRWQSEWLGRVES